MMKQIRLLFLPALLLMFVAAGCSGLQKTKNPPLGLDWEILAEDYQGGGTVLNRLTITNHSDQALGETDWTLYFNGHRTKAADTTDNPVAVTWINGDYNKLEPTKDFPGLAPGESIAVLLNVSGLRNLIDIPQGFYLVSDGYPEGVNLSVNLLPSEEMDRYEARIASRVYHRNTDILPVEESTMQPILPSPAAYEYRQDVSFLLDASVALQTDERFAAESGFLQELMQDVLGRKLGTTAKSEGKTISLLFEDGMGAEAYRLDITSASISLKATSNTGMFYAIQSLKGLLPLQAWQGKQTSLSLPGISISDEPRFAYRAFMLDVSRNFQPKEQVFKLLDLMAAYKLNVFRFHLTEDEAWRLEIPGLPELTEVGSRRGHTMDDGDRLVPSYGSGAEAGKLYGSGYYTRADFIEILKYAAKRHIRVLPEIETPGHARAAIKSMEARYHRYMTKGDSTAAWQYRLTDPADSSAYRSAQVWTDNVMNVSMPSVYTFLDKVFDELIAMYKEAGAPLQNIHIGGDEVPNGVWEKSPIVDRFMAANPQIPHTDELWYYYLDRVSTLLKDKGLYMSGWEEIGMKKVRDESGRGRMLVEPRFADRNFHVDVWNNVGANADLAYRLANEGYQVVLTSVSNFYFDLAHHHGFYEKGHHWGGVLDIDKPFRFVPFDYYKSIMDDRSGKPVPFDSFRDRLRPTAAGKANIIGLQAPLWAEFIVGEERMEYMVLPKLLALAERAWAPAAGWENLEDEAFDSAYQLGWSRFLYRVGLRELPRLDRMNGGFHYRIPTPGVEVIDGIVHANVQFPGLLIRYTTDGTEPLADSPVYTGPLEAKGSLVFKVFNGDGRSGRPVRISN